MQIRLATTHDIEAMYEVTSSVHLSALYRDLIPASQYDRFRRRYEPSVEGLTKYVSKVSAHLRDPQWRVWVAEIDDEVVGFTETKRHEDQFELKGLFVGEAHQGKGIGRALFKISCAAAAKLPITLEVIAANRRAIDLYIKNGFMRLDEPAPHYYGAKMVRMRKH